MPQRITVVVPTRDPGPALTGLVGGLDAQTARADAFEVVFADSGSTDGSLARLERLSGSRPNVTVLPDAALTDAVAAATGDHVLVLDQEWRLLPEALERLAARVASGGADVVAGRCRYGNGRYSGPLGSGDEGLLVPPSQVTELGDAVLLVRRDLLRSALADDAQAAWPLRVLQSAAAVAVVSDYACATAAGAEQDGAEQDGAEQDGAAQDGAAQDGAAQDGAAQDGAAQDAAPGQGAGLTAGPAHVSWGEEVLRVEVALTLPEGDEDVEHLLVLERADGVEIALPTSATLLPVPLAAVPADPSGAEAPIARDHRVLLSAELACGPEAAPSAGVYAVRVQRRSPSGGEVSVPAEGAAPALVAGRPVLAHAVEGKLQVDVGATVTSLLAALPVAGTVTEDARGSLLRLPLPDLHAFGAGRLAGTLGLGGLGLPAEVVTEQSDEGWRAELRCFVSGLEGRSRLVAHFGGGEGGTSPSGVDLVMSHLGTFTLEPTPTPVARAPKKAAPTKTATKEAAPKKTATAQPAPAKPKPKPRKKVATPPPTRLQLLRRRIPSWLEPAVQPLAALPPARALYRRLNRR